MQGINYNTALVTLVSCVDRSKLINAGLGKLLPRRKHRKGTCPGEFTQELNQMATSNSNTKVTDQKEPWTENNTESKWIPTKSTFNLKEKKLIIKEYVRYLIDVCMSLHSYRIGNEVWLSITEIKTQRRGDTITQDHSVLH